MIRFASAARCRSRCGGVGKALATMPRPDRAVSRAEEGFYGRCDMHVDLVRHRVEAQDRIRCHVDAGDLISSR